jgi:hypothetical protein
VNITIVHERLGRKPFTVSANFAATVRNPDGSVSYVLSYYMRSQAESALAYYESLGWSGEVEPIAL